MLGVLYLGVYYTFAFFLPDRYYEAEIQQEKLSVLFRYRKVIFVASLSPCLLLGLYQIRVMQLVRKGPSGYNTLCEMLFHKNCKRMLFCGIAICYILMMVAVATYALFGESEAKWIKRKYLIQALEEDD